jgi:hypothetical protein
VLAIENDALLGLLRPPLQAEGEAATSGLASTTQSRRRS